MAEGEIRAKPTGVWTGRNLAIIVALLVVTNAVTGVTVFFTTRPSPALIVSFALSSEEAEVIYNDVVPLFEARRGVSVEVVDIRPAQFVDIVRAQAKVGRAPVDVFGLDNLALAALVEENLVLDLSESEGDIDDAVHHALIDAGKFDGNLMFMPYRPNVQITYYNKAKFTAAGLNPPTTWDELKTVAAAFTASEGEGRILFKFEGPDPNAAVMPTQAFEWIASASTGDISVIPQQIVEFTADGYKPWFQFLLDIKSDISPAAITAKWDTSNTAFVAGSAFWMQNWPFGVAVIPAEGFPAADMGTYKGVAGPQREAHVIGGEVMGIPLHSRNPGLALEFITFMQSQEVQEILATELAWPSIRDDAYETIAAADLPHFQSIDDALASGIFRPNVVYWDDWQTLYHEAFDRIYNEGEDIDTVINDVKADMADIIAGG